MKLVKKFGVYAFLALSVLSAFSFNPLLTKPVRASGDFSQYITNNSDYYFVNGSVTVNDITVGELFEFAADATNDTIWYPGVVGSVLTSGNGGAGTTYTQTLDFGGIQLTSYLEILAEVHNVFVLQKATGAFENYALYTFKKQGNNVKFTIRSAVKKAEGVTPEGLAFVLNGAFPNLLNHLGKTGTFTVSVI